VAGFQQEILRVKERVTALSAHRVRAEVQSQVFLDKEQMKILDFLDQVGKITASDVVDILECPKRTAQLHLQRLKKLGIIVQVGKGPASAYIFANP
jgi:Fic family protein